MAEATEAVATETDVDETAEDKASAEELAGFEAAMEDKPLPKEEKTEEAEVETETPVVDAAAEAKPAETPAEPELAAVTKAQLAELLQTANSVKELNAGLEKLRSDAFGKVGGLERLLKQAKEMVDSGLEVNLTDEDFAEVDTEVPMLTKPLQKLITKLVKNAKVKVPAAQPVDLTEFETRVNTEVDKRIDAKVAEVKTQAYRDMQAELLTDKYPDWQATVQDKGFHSWIAEEDKAHPGTLKTFQESWSAREIGGVLKKFHAHVEAEKAKAQPPKPKPVVKAPANRTQRLLEAVPAKASSATPRPKGELSEEDAFELAAAG